MPVDSQECATPPVKTPRCPGHLLLSEEMFHGYPNHWRGSSPLATAKRCAHVFSQHVKHSFSSLRLHRSGGDQQRTRRRRRLLVCDGVTRHHPDGSLRHLEEHWIRDGRSDESDPAGMADGIDLMSPDVTWFHLSLPDGGFLLFPENPAPISCGKNHPVPISASPCLLCVHLVRSVYSTDRS